MLSIVLCLQKCKGNLIDRIKQKGPVHIIQLDGNSNFPICCKNMNVCKPLYMYTD